EREGFAEAAAIRAKGEAEAEAMQKKADAFEQYGQAAVLDLMAGMLPELVRSASEPLSAIDNMTVISTDGAGPVTRNAVSSVAQGLQLATDLTGFDIRSLVNKGNGSSDKAATTGESTSLVEPPPPPPPPASDAASESDPGSADD